MNEILLSKFIPTGIESFRLKTLLELNKVPFNTQVVIDAPNTLNGYHFFVEEHDYKRALKVLRLYKAEMDFIREMNKSTCENCLSKSPVVKVKSNLTLFEKIRFIGLTPMRCSHCGNEWCV